MSAHHTLKAPLLLNASSAEKTGSSKRLKRDVSERKQVYLSLRIPLRSHCINVRYSTHRTAPHRTATSERALRGVIGIYGCTVTNRPYTRLGLTASVLTLPVARFAMVIAHSSLVMTVAAGADQSLCAYFTASSHTSAPFACGTHECIQARLRSMNVIYIGIALWCVQT